MADSDRPHLLIVEARFYEDMADAMLDGAKHALAEAGATFDVVTVPGATTRVPPSGLNPQFCPLKPGLPRNNSSPVLVAPDVLYSAKPA